MDDALFDDAGLRIALDTQPTLTAGERLRIRQTARIAAGMHPLAINGSVIRLHPDAPTDAYKGDGGTYPRCGGCRFRVLVGGHARDFPKCRAGADLSDAGRPGPRESSGEATDVRAWWPACADYAPAEAVAS